MKKISFTCELTNAVWNSAANGSSYDWTHDELEANMELSVAVEIRNIQQSRKKQDNYKQIYIV